MKVKNDFVMREIAGDYILVPTGSTAIEFNGLITVNEVGAFLWEKMQEETTVEKLTQAVFDEYEVDRETAGKDVEEFIDRLKEAGIIA